MTALGIRSFSGGGPVTALTGDITTSDDITIDITTIVTDVWPDVTIGPFTVVLDRGVVGSEEQVLVDAITTTSMHIPSGGRGQNKTSAVAHGVGCTVSHGFDAAVAADFSQHVYDTTRNDHTQYPLKTVWNNAGVLITASAAGDLEVVAAPSTGQFLSELDGIPTWASLPTVSDSGWVNPTLGNSWANSAGYTTSYRKIGNRVTLRGAIGSGTTGTTVFTLPTGSHQTTNPAVQFAVDSNNGTGIVKIDSSGNLSILVYTGSIVLDGISFLVD